MSKQFIITALTFFGLSIGVLHAQTWNIGTPTATDVVATLSNDTLTISGSGAMQNFANAASEPWYTARSGITKVIIESGVASIGNYAFRECYNLTEVAIPVSVSSIGMSAFRDCHSLPSIVIPPSVTSLGSSIFFDCNSLVSATILAAISVLPSNVFYNCSSLISVTLPMTLTTIDSYAFGFCVNLTTITIPDLTTSINYGAFQSCRSLTSINIPAGISSFVGTDYFDGCINLTAIDVAAANAYYGSIDGIVYSKNSENLLFCPQGKAGVVNISALATKIGYRAFYNCLKITSINIPNTITYIESYAFYHCEGLTSITIPNSVDTLEAGVFYYCRGLLSATMSHSITKIEDYMFEGCENLTMIDISNLITKIGNNAFSNCFALPFVTIPDLVTSIGSNAFQNCTALSVVNYNAANCNSVGNDVFDNCPSLSALNIGTHVRSIPNNAFSSLVNLAIVRYNAEHCTTAGIALFQNSVALSSVVIGTDVQVVPSGIFNGCSSLGTITFNAINCTSMGSSTNPVFGGCTDVVTLNIASGVTRVPAFAFKGCTGLCNIFNKRTTPQPAGAGSFDGVSRTGCRLSIPLGSRNAYQQAPIWQEFFSIVEINFNIDITSITLNKSVDSVTVGHSLQLMAAILPNNATNKNLLWTSSDVRIATISATGLVNGIAPGVAVITVTTDDGNYTASCYIIVKNSTELNDFVSADAIRIYPNPVRDELFIENEHLLIKSIEIVAMTGKIVYNSPFIVANPIHVSILPAGIYLIKIETDKGIVTKKIIKN